MPWRKEAGLWRRTAESIVAGTDGSDEGRNNEFGDNGPSLGLWTGD
ncbi:hypothetical protein IQ265_20245 [Nodosilinea sp. LEGE 06152]|nr:hypothetical protein [Nodosilinea sp. LEGE 06152]MBE9159148.1 hypothetical protein [Nodosilinea sp. LEGE 06152]